MRTMSQKEHTSKHVDAMNLKQSVKTLWPYLMVFKGRVLLAVLALIAAKGATLLMPWALKEIIDAVDGNLQAILIVPVALLLLYA